jgi:hypothetical protein
MRSSNVRLRERLLAQAAPAGDRIAGYRKEVRAMIEEKERRLRRERRVASSMWMYLVILCTVFLVVGGFRGGEDRLWFGILASFWFVFGSVFLLRYYLNRNRLEFLKEIKGLEIRLAELAEKGQESSSR